VAADVVEYLLGRQGYRPVSRPGPLEADGEPDLIWAVESPAGERLWVVAEARYRLRAEDVAKFAQKFRSRGFRERLKAAGIPGPYLPYVFRNSRRHPDRRAGRRTGRRANNGPGGGGGAQGPEA